MRSRAKPAAAFGVIGLVLLWLVSRSSSTSGTTMLPMAVRRPHEAAAHPVSGSRIALGLNTVVTGGRWKRNYERIFSLYSREGSLFPNTFIFSDEELTPEQSGGPWIRRVPVEQWQERWVTMLGHLWAAVPAAVRPNIDWFVMGDDDSYFFAENLLATLGKYDPSLPWYLGRESEDLTIAEQLTRMGMGGGGVALSRPLVQALVEHASHPHSLASCLVRYAPDFGGDKKLALCVADAGGMFTREPGFHQLDVRGDYSGLLAYEVSKTPLLSLHHMYVSPPIFTGAWSPGHELQSPKRWAERTAARGAGGQGTDVLAAMDQLFASYSDHTALVGPEAFLALHVAHVRQLRVTLALNIGWSLRLFTGPPKPRSHFFKLIPADADVWEPAARMVPANADRGSALSGKTGTVIKTAASTGSSGSSRSSKAGKGSMDGKSKAKAKDSSSADDVVVATASAPGGVDYDTRPSDDPCTYTTYEWQATALAPTGLELPPQPASPPAGASTARPPSRRLPPALSRLLAAAGVPPRSVLGAGRYDAVPRTLQGCGAPPRSGGSGADAGAAGAAAGADGDVVVAVDEALPKRVLVIYMACHAGTASLPGVTVLAIDSDLAESAADAADASRGLRAASPQAAAEATVTGPVASEALAELGQGIDMVVLAKGCRAVTVDTAYPASWDSDNSAA